MIENNIRLCEELWNQFSPNTSIWDLWMANLSFYNPKVHKPYFIFIEKGGEKGLLPLYYDTIYKRYYFFGGGYPENRDFWFSTKMFPTFFEEIPIRTTLFDIKESTVRKITNLFPEYSRHLQEIDYRYFLDLKKIEHNIDNFFQSFSKKHYKNLRYDLKKLKNIPYKIEWTSTIETIALLVEKLMELNIKRFKERSDFEEAESSNEFEQLTNYLSQEKLLHVLEISLGNEIVGIEVAALFNRHYYVLNSGFEESQKNLGKLMTIEHIKKAIELKADDIDFLVGDTGWKKLWNLNTEPVYTFRKDV